MMDVEGEIRDLKRRVGELEGGFGFLTQQVRTVHLDLLGFQSQTNARFDKVDGRLDKMDGRLDKVEGRLDRVEGRLGRVEAEVRQLREELPTVVGDVMREVLREQKR
jgi:tetrahydromethanopterin S-methyltransferase subunit G